MSDYTRRKRGNCGYKNNKASTRGSSSPENSLGVNWARTEDSGKKKNGTLIDNCGIPQTTKLLRASRRRRGGRRIFRSLHGYRFDFEAEAGRVGGRRQPEAAAARRKHMKRKAPCLTMLPFHYERAKYKRLWACVRIPLYLRLTTTTPLTDWLRVWGPAVASRRRLTQRWLFEVSKHHYDTSCTLDSGTLFLPFFPDSAVAAAAASYMRITVMPGIPGVVQFFLRRPPDRL